MYIFSVALNAVLQLTKKTVYKEEWRVDRRLNQTKHTKLKLNLQPVRSLLFTALFCFLIFYKLIFLRWKIKKNVRLPKSCGKRSTSCFMLQERFLQTNTSPFCLHFYFVLTLHFNAVNLFYLKSLFMCVFCFLSVAQGDHSYTNSL